MPNDNSDEELKHGTPRKDDKSADAQDSDILTNKADHPDGADTESAKINWDELEANLARLCAKKVIDEHEFKLLRKNWESCHEDDFPDSKQKQRIQTAVESTRDAIHKQIKVRSQKYEKLLHIVNQFEEAVFNGKLQDVLQHQQEAKNLITEIPALSPQRRSDVHARLNRQYEKISELRKWRHWATNVTRDELIEQIEALAESTETPVTERAQKIQEARTTWQQWDKSSDGASKSLWTRFDTACTNAYEPCKQHFAKQAERRAENKKKMERICEYLETLANNTNWRDADWRKVDKEVRNAKRDWYQKPELEHRDRRHLNKRFANVMGEITPHLEREHKRNRNRREALIASVEALANMEDIEQAIQAAKQAQANWKPTVAGTRKDEQEMWERFTAAGDAVYARKKLQRKEAISVEKDNIKAKLALCEQIETFENESETNADEIKSKLAVARSNWHDIGPINKQRDTELENRFRQSCKAVQSHLRTLAARHAQKANELLKQKVYRCIEIEQSDSIDTELTQAAWNELPKLSDELEILVTQRFENALNQTTIAKTKLEDNQEKLETLLLDAELLAGVDSPPEYAKARMALQVSKLSAAMSGTKNETKVDKGAERIDALEQDFWITGPISDYGLFASLTQRLDKVRVAMAKQIEIEQTQSRKNLPEHAEKSSGTKQNYKSGKSKPGKSKSGKQKSRKPAQHSA